MATIGLGFQLSANATQMSAGINAGVTELQKLGYAAKKTAADVATLRNIEIGRAFISAVQTVTNTFTNFTSGAAQAVDSTLKLSRALGISYQELRTLQLAADLSGASSEQLATAFTRAQVTITKAGQGSKEAIAALQALGLTVDDLANKSVTEQFSALGAAISRIQDPAQRAAAAVAIFGRSGAQLLPVFQGLPDSLRQAQGFLDQFKGGLDSLQAGRIEALNDSFTLAREALRELAARLLAELQPALQAGAEQFVKFASQIDIRSAARTVEAALSDLVGVFSGLSRVLTPLVRNLLPSIGGYLAFINRQAITFVASQIAEAMYTSAAAALGYAGAAKQAAAATAVLATTMRGFLISTGVGALVVAFGIAAGALVDWGLSAANAGDDVQQALQASQEEAARLVKPIDDATEAARRFGVEAEKAFKLPAEITDRTLLQGTVDDAAQAFKKFAAEAGGLGNIPRELAAAFDALQVDIDNVNNGFVESADGQSLIRQSAEQVLKIVNDIAKARKDEEDATKRVAEAAAKATDEARKRTEELAAAGVSEAEKSRLQLQKDLLAIQQAVADAEKQLADARAANDSDAISAAQERLNLTRETAKAAEATARDQAKQRNLEARGLSAELFKPARTLEDQLRALKDAVQANDITREQGNLGFNRLIERGLQIRKEISRELSKPAQRALEIQDVRTSAGISEFVRLATGREDPAIEQSRDQLKELKEIRTAIKNVFPLAIVDI